MKMRSGFVSNSSSSSFIIKFDPNNLKEAKSDDFVNEGPYCVEDDQWYEDESLEERKEKRKELQKIVDNGGIVLSRSIEYGADEELRDILNALGIEFEEDYC